MEDVLGLRGAKNHPPPAALVSAKSARDDRITAGFRFMLHFVKFLIYNKNVSFLLLFQLSELFHLIFIL
jgi:hypothetical protein